MKAARTCRQALLDRRHHLRIGRRRDALAPHQAKRRVVGQRPLAGGAISIRGHSAGRTRRAFSSSSALLAAEQNQRQPLADAFDLAAGVGQHARLDRRAVEADQEMLVLLDLCAVARLHGDDRRAAGGESELAPAGERRIDGRAARRGARLPLGAKPGRAPDAGRQGLAEVVDPDSVARPAARAHRCRTLARDGERVGEPWVAEGDHGVGELDRDLADLRDLALRAGGDDGGRRG